MRLKCVGCGEKEKVRFYTWWFYFAIAAPGTGPWLHIPCWDDYVDQRRLDGLEDDEV